MALVHAFTHEETGRADPAASAVVGLDEHPRVLVLSLVLLVFVERLGEQHDVPLLSAVCSRCPCEGGELHGAHFAWFRVAATRGLHQHAPSGWAAIESGFDIAPFGQVGIREPVTFKLIACPALGLFECGRARQAWAERFAHLCESGHHLRVVLALVDNRGDDLGVAHFDLWN